MKKITVVTVTYNCVKVIEETILSVICQDYPNIEYIIIDGASIDGTIDVIKKYAENITYWVSEPDNGLYDAMNKAIMVATGDYINFMNAGDSFCASDVIRRIVEQIEDDTIVAHGDIMKIAKGYRYRACPPSIEKASERMPAYHQAAFTQLSYHKLNLFDLQYKSSADYNFFYQAVLKNHVKFQYIPILVANFDCCDGTSNVNYKRSQRESLKIRGDNNNWKKKLRLEWWFFTVDVKRWVKKHLMSEEKSRNIEVSRLRKEGYYIQLDKK